MTLEPRKGEKAIRLLANSEAPARCLQFPPDAMRGKEVNRLWRVRGDGGQAVVRGYRRGTSPNDAVIRAEPALVKKVTDSDSANALDALISEAGWIASLPEFGWQALLQVGAALVTFAAVVLGLIVSLVSSEDPSGVLIASLGVGCVAALITLVSTVVKALTIRSE